MADITNIDAAYHWNISKISEAFKLDRATVRKRINTAGVEPVGQKGQAKLYALRDVAPALYRDERAGGDELETDPEKMMPKDRKDWYAGEKDRLATEETKGDLVRVASHRESHLKVLKAVVSFMEGVPDSMERTRRFNVEQLEALTGLCDGYRNDLYEELRQLARQGGEHG